MLPSVSDALNAPEEVTDLRDGLRAAVELLYVTFRRYPPRHPVPGSVLSVTERDQALLASAPLRDLPPEALSRYAFKAMTSWGDDRDFRHFLPRMLELSAFEPDPGRFIDANTLFGKLELANWRDWPAIEQHAVLAYVDALWPWALSGYPSPLGQMDDVVTALCVVVDEIDPYLQLWRNRHDVPAVMTLAELVIYSQLVMVKQGRLVIRDRGLPNLRRVGEWMLEPDTGARLEQAFNDHADQPYSPDLALAVQRLEAWAHTPLGRWR